MKTFRRVFVLVETTSGYSRGILEGIGQYRHEHQGWSVFSMNVAWKSSRRGG